MKTNLKEFDFSKLVENIQNEITMVSSTMKEKGTNKFVRTIVVCVAMVFGSYQFVYNPPAAKILGMQRTIDAARATSQFADSYLDLKTQLDGCLAKLPDVKDRERWLTDTALNALKDEGLLSDSIVPPEEQLQNGFAVQRVTVAMTAKFSEVYALLRRIETIKPVMHIASLEINKTEKIEMNMVSFSVATMVPLKKGP